MISTCFSLSSQLVFSDWWVLWNTSFARYFHSVRSVEVDEYERVYPKEAEPVWVYAGMKHFSYPEDKLVFFSVDRLADVRFKLVL